MNFGGATCCQVGYSERSARLAASRCCRRGESRTLYAVISDRRESGRTPFAPNSVLTRWPHIGQRHCRACPGRTRHSDNRRRTREIPLGPRSLLRRRWLTRSRYEPRRQARRWVHVGTAHSSALVSAPELPSHVRMLGPAPLRPGVPHQFPRVARCSLEKEHPLRKWEVFPPRGGSDGTSPASLSVSWSVLTQLMSG